MNKKIAKILDTVIAAATVISEVQYELQKTEQQRQMESLMHTLFGTRPTRRFY